MKKFLYDKINGEWVFSEYKLSNLIRFVFIVAAIFITMSLI